MEFLASWLGSVVAPIPWTLQQDRPAGDHIIVTNQILFGISNNLIIDRLFDKRYLIKAFLGLDNAGKTSLVQLLSTGVVHQVFVTPIEN